MGGIEKDILILVSKVRCVTENQVGKFFGNKKTYKNPFKKALRKMCNDSTLRKYPCNINYPGYKENSYVYYLNGGKIQRGKALDKVVIGSEIIVRMKSNGYQIKRLYRNVRIDYNKFDLFIEYIDKYNELRQILIDIDIDKNFNIKKYRNMKHQIENTTIPFFEVPKVLIVTTQNLENTIKNNYDIDMEFVDMHLNKLFKYI